jgi:hypothetical protein
MHRPFDSMSGKQHASATIPININIKTIKTIDNGFYNLIVEKIDNEIVNKEILFVRNEENQGCVKRILTLNNDMLYSDKSDSDKPWSDLP